MNIIKKLSSHEAQKIAAGEVVERPANIVKELLENSLDAGATVIKISAIDGGKKSLTITDNGCGMSFDDARLCVERHTTSKITTVDELQNITTFGFRGEALASICSVAQVTLITKQQDKLEGIKLSIIQGVLQKEECIGAPVGTSIIIDDLFFNVPARKKFLKSTAVEWNHIATLIKAYALSNPLIHFIIEHNDTILYNCPSVTTIQERIFQLFDNTFGRSTIALTQQTERETTVSGVITHHHYGRYDRSGIFLFVNKRWVKNYGLSNAFIKGYMNVLPSGKYPAGVLMIEVPADTLDINVHPKKEEVVFTHPKIIEAFVTKIITEALEKHLNSQISTNTQVSPSRYNELRSSLDVPEQNKLHSPFDVPGYSEFRSPFDVSGYGEFRSPFDVSKTNEFHSPFDMSKTEGLQTPRVFLREQKCIERPPFDIPKFEEPQTQQILTATETPYAQHNLIGQYNKTYLLLNHVDGLYLVDQHAAHERILYEKFESKFEKCIASPLLFPLIITMPSEHILLLTEYIFIFANYGIIFEKVGPQELCISQLPLILKNQSIDDLLKNVITLVHNETSINEELLKKKISEHVRAQMACKAAIKAGDILSNETMHHLLQELQKTPHSFTCPHGRPTGWLLKLSDIERTFKRIS